MKNCFRVCFRFIFVCFGFTLSCFVLWLPFTGLYRANSPGLREKEKRNGIIPMGLCYGKRRQSAYFADYQLNTGFRVEAGKGHKSGIVSGFVSAL